MVSRGKVQKHEAAGRLSTTSNIHLPMSATLRRIRSLEDGDCATYRCGVYGRNGIEWGNWKTGYLYVVKREVNLPRRIWRNRPGYGWQAGALLILAVHHDSGEFREEDYSPGNDAFAAEENVLQIDWDLTFTPHRPDEY